MEKISLYLVEDYFLSRASYKYSLEKFEQIEFLGDFENAQSCIDAMDKKQADIILMDLGLENMNGIEATKIIKQKYPNTKVIILTSHESENEVLACLYAGASAYALKDIPIEKLVEVIKAVNFGANWYDPHIAHIPFNSIPKPQSYEFNNLYPSSDEIKNLLTERELEVLKLLVEGKSNIEIAQEISISAHTAKAHVCSIISKLNVADRTQAAIKAVRTKLF